MNIDIAGTLSYAVFELVLPLTFSFSFIVFIWGVFQYFIAGGHDEAAREKSKALMLYGIIVFVLMTALWYVSTFISNLFTS